MRDTKPLHLQVFLTAVQFYLQLPPGSSHTQPKHNTLTHAPIMRQSPEVAELTFFSTGGAAFYPIMPVLFLTMRAIFLFTFGYTRT